MQGIVDARRAASHRPHASTTRSRLRPSLPPPTSFSAIWCAGGYACATLPLLLWVFHLFILLRFSSRCLRAPSAAAPALRRPQSITRHCPSNDSLRYSRRCEEAEVGEGRTAPHPRTRSTAAHAFLLFPLFFSG